MKRSRQVQPRNKHTRWTNKETMQFPIKPHGWTDKGLRRRMQSRFPPKGILLGWTKWCNPFADETVELYVHGIMTMFWSAEKATTALGYHGTAEEFIAGVRNYLNINNEWRSPHNHSEYERLVIRRAQQIRFGVNVCRDTIRGSWERNLCVEEAAVIALIDSPLWR